MKLSKYTPTKGLWVITTYYNPCRYKTRRDNYDIFAESLLRSKIPLLTVECAFGDEPFELKPAPHVIQIRSKSLLWQKERLLNLAATCLPPECENVAWIDCDVLFENLNWAVDTTELLQSFKVVQLFDVADRLNKQGCTTTPPDLAESFSKITSPDPASALAHERYDVHGHTGYAWAMKRELFTEIGLYEHAIGGSADHYMAHAIYGDCGFCIKNTLRTEAQLEHFKAWARRFHRQVDGSLATVPGKLIHLWHGELKDRRYYQRMLELASLDYNPYTDVEASPGKPLEWKTSKPALQQYFYEYFKNRREDGHEATEGHDRVGRKASLNGSEAPAAA